MIREYKDRRIKRTIGRIRDAFRVLVLENDYDSLNVSMLCEKAHIGRKTFYVYYPALDAIFEEELERITVKFLERIKGLRPPEDFADITREFYHFSQEQGKFYESLICSKSYHAIGEKLMLKLIRDTWNNSPWFKTLRKEYQGIVVSFIYNAGADLYRNWVLSGKTIPVEMIGKIANGLVTGGIGRFSQLI